MSDILCVTNRALCKGNFLSRIEEIARKHPAGIILREKDLLESEYKKLAEQVLEICEKHQVPCVLHSFVDVAVELGAEALHLPLPVLRELPAEKKSGFRMLGASCHSVEEAQEAVKLGCTYLVVGHIFATACKKGLPGRGTSFLKSVCDSVSVPVYAIGGINARNIAEVREAGAKGACVMSGWMQCENAGSFLESFQ